MAQQDYIGISEDRLKHSLQVGRTAFLLAKNLFEWDEKRCRKMFILGLVHDCGYEFATVQSEHPIIGATILSECDYRFAEEIRWHGVASPPYASDELLILNIADLLTDKSGRTVTLDERLSDIRNRYGESSNQYAEACQLAAEIAEKLNAIETIPRAFLENWNMQALL